MHVISATNVRDALPKAVKYLLDFGIKEETRLGEAWVARSPICIRYYYPKQHVLVNPVRDANPFFHLMEAMWMLAGRDDGAFLDHYVKNFSKDFGVNGIIPDAYGYRWRHCGCDQLLEIAKQLKADPSSRQAVLQMWGAKAYEFHELEYNGPKACNLVATFRIREGELDMTVFNRSNDLIWGACGANAVHFPIMQEYLTSMIGVRMGEYWQISNNLHLYASHINMLEKRLTIQAPEIYSERNSLYVALKTPGYEETMPLIEAHSESFDEELFDTMILIDLINRDEPVYEGNIANPFLKNVVLPMAHAHRFYKTRATAQALIEIENVAARDWRRAGKEWIQRRTSIRVGEEEYGQPV